MLSPCSREGEVVSGLAPQPQRGFGLFLGPRGHVWGLIYAEKNPPDTVLNGASWVDRPGISFGLAYALALMGISSSVAQAKAYLRALWHRKS